MTCLCPKRTANTSYIILTKDITEQTCGLLGKVIELRADIREEVPGGRGGHGGRARPGTASTARSAGRDTTPYAHAALVSVADTDVAPTETAPVGANNAAAWNETHQ